jgi:hypothetical protein
MKSPHKQGWGAYEDPFSHREIPLEEERLITQAYKFLGWQVTSDKVPEYKHCYDKGHNYGSAFPNAWHSKQHSPRGSDVTGWCTLCRIYWKTDMSD